MEINILTLFPEMIDNIAKESILGRAQASDNLKISAINIRDYTKDKHNRVDDYTYGGGAGMLIEAQPVYDCFLAVNGTEKSQDTITVYMTPQGTPFNQKKALELASYKKLNIICGHYEGIDERVLEKVVDEYISIGDYVLTGGELGAMVVVDAVSRLVPGVLGNDLSAEEESFHRNLLEYPQYTRPEVWEGMAVPKELLSGDPKTINAWRKDAAIKRTRERRPDLYEKYLIDQEVIAFAKGYKREYVFATEAINRGQTQVLYYEAGAVAVVKNYVQKHIYIIAADNSEINIPEHIIKQIKDLDCRIFGLHEEIGRLLPEARVESYIQYVFPGHEKKMVKGEYTIADELQFIYQTADTAEEMGISEATQRDSLQRAINYHLEREEIPFTLMDENDKTQDIFTSLGFFKGKGRVLGFLLK